MSFHVEYSLYVEGEVKEIVDWYNEKSHAAAINFLSQLHQAEKIILKTHLRTVLFQTRVSGELF